VWQTTLDGTNRHTFVSPRVWFTTAPRNFRINVAVQSGSRGPTINELYRPFRVGNTFTRANPLLKPEDVRGFEAGVSHSLGRSTVRVLGFWSRVDDAIVNVTLSSSGGVITRERQNAARIRARGGELELESRVSKMLTLTASSAYTDSSFVEGPLEGLLVPQVPRWHLAIGGRGVIGAARWSAEWRFIDEQFDDDRNLFPLDESAMFDARVGWMLTRKVEVFGAIENVLDEEQDVGRTPIRTIGLPRSSRVGVRIIFQ
jgi:outer membrane receptor protein involved in Fe transport